MPTTHAKQILIYADEYGHEPYRDWIDNLKDKKNQQRIRARIRRLAEGLYGDCHSVGEGILELRMFLVPDTGFILAKMPTIS